MPSSALRHAIVRPPGANFAEGLTSSKGPRADWRLALQQHQCYCDALERAGLQLTRLPADLECPDSTFVEDVAVLLRSLAVLARPGASSRQAEVAKMREPLARFFREIREITAPGTLDGGDVCRAESHFYIGLSRRTNEEGARQLAQLLAEEGCTSTFVDIREIDGILHLKSGMTYLGDNTFAVTEAVLRAQRFDGCRVVSILAEESYAANCLRVNDRLLVPTGYDDFAGRLKECGFDVEAVEMSEFRKMDGGLSCLSLRF